MDLERFESRKRDHLRHALDPAHQATGVSLLASIRLRHEALPERDLREVMLRPVAAPWKALDLPTPFFIAGMTAGHADAPAINLLLARACARRGWAMGVGSQRRQLTQSDPGNQIDEWKRIRAEVPEVRLLGNIGLSQIASLRIDEARRLVDSIAAQGLAVHANALQECLQPEGTPEFRGATAALGQLCQELGVPVVLKETGCGFSEATLKRVRDLGLAAVDVSGAGGTHWGRIEGARAAETGLAGPHAAAAVTFADWGVSAVDSVLAAASVLDPTRTEIWASGGVRSGLDAAKLIALGAHRVGYAQPALAAALQGEVALNRWMEQQEFELRTALFCTGCASPDDLRGNGNVWTRN